jgi:mannitol/fructose-specific phosphotransferase system IIA component
VTIRDAVRDLIESRDFADFTGNAGQIRFVQALQERGAITSTNLGRFFSALDPAWRQALDWTQIDLPLAEAVTVRKAVRELLVDSGDLAAYTGNAGQIHFVQALKDRGAITSTYLGHIFSALDPAWLRALNWTVINLPLAEAVAMRKAVRELVDGEDSADYLGNAGQIRFVQALQERRAITSTYLAQFYTALDPAWRQTLGWTQIYLSLERAVRMLSSIDAQLAAAAPGPLTPELEGVRQRVAIDPQGRIADWFGGDGLPARLQAFSGRLVGYPVAVQDGVPALVVRLKAPLGYAVYSFSAYSADQSQLAEVEIVMQDGIPSSFLLWSEGQAQPVQANNALLLGERPDTAIKNASGGDGFEREMVDDALPVAEHVERRVLAITLQSILSERYGAAQAQRIIVMFSEFDTWTQDEALPETVAYERLEAEFGVSREDFAGYRDALREWLGSRGFNAGGFAGEDR